MSDEKKIASVALDDEFENLIMPLSEIDCHRLRLAIRNACDNRIRVWQNIVICDSQIYKLCRDYDFECSLDEINFTSRSAALSYICQEELKRDDLTHEYKKYLIGKRFNADYKRSSLLKTSKLSIARVLAEEYLISAGAIQKYGQFAAAIDRLFIVAPEVSKYILCGQLKLSHENTVEVSQLPKNDLNVVEQIISDSWGKRITITDLRHAIRWKSFVDSDKTRSKPKKPVESEIKKMPAYDPDADISSLTLTIPSWIRVIEHAINNSALEKTSYEGRRKLRNQLFALDDAVVDAIEVLEV